MPQDAGETYAWLLSPLTAEEFERTYYQQRVCVVRRDAPGYYRGLLSLDELDHVVASHSLKQPDLTIVQLDRDIPAAQYTDAAGLVDPLRATKLFAGGATLVFARLHAQLPAPSRLCLAIGQVLSSKMQMNTYLTPANAQGFKPHWDTHDVFVLQISGSKEWTIYDTKITLPLRGQQFDAEKHKAGDPTDKFELKAGDLLYIPRGVMHAARSTADVSLHITTGLMAFTWADLFLQGVAAAALADESFRESLPLGFATAGFPAERKAGLLREKLSRVSAYLESEPQFAYFAHEVLAHNRPCFVNLLKQTATLGRIGVESTLRVRPGATWELQQTETSCVVRCFGNQVELPKFVAPALELILRSPKFSVGEIPDCVDDPGKLTLVRRLVKEGLLECLDAEG